jgi:hypothetical protein
VPNKLLNIIILISISVSILNDDDGVYLELPKYGEV